jgi:hypothetical protein
MRLRDRLHNQPAQDKPSSGGELSLESDSSLVKAEELLKAGDDAIRKALSGNSVEFLLASRQAGGQ